MKHPAAARRVGPRVLLPGWAHPPLRDSLQIHARQPDKHMEVTVVLRPRSELPDVHASFGSQLPRNRKHRTPEQLAADHGATASDMEQVRAFAREHGLEVVYESPPRRIMVLGGPSTHVELAFDVEFHHFHHARGSYFAASRPPSIPANLAGIVEAVLGLHTRPSARRHASGIPSREARTHSLRQLAEAYAFPAATDGAGQCIGLIELGGGFHMQDVADYCSALGIRTPRITIVPVRGGCNHPAKPHEVLRLVEEVQGELRLSAAAMESAGMLAAQSTVEVTMDVEIVAALAPGAHIVVYFATPDEQGIYHALSHAVHDTLHRPSVLSLSWGEPETGLSDALIHAVDRVLLAAAHLGVTVCASSGDSGAFDDASDTLPVVNFPASSPHCLACGGTTTRLQGSQVAEEVVWDSTWHGVKGATGGGVSRKFPPPPWQKRARVPLGPTGKPGRGVPDVAGPADPRFGGEILVGGATCAAAGTSAVAPMWAALLARCNQALDARCGHLHPLLYSAGHRAASVLRPVTQGQNGYYHASGAGWNACTGHGTPHGENLLRHLREG